MGYRYHASVTFPAIARQVAEISQYLDDDSLGYEVMEEDDLIIVASQDANYGELPITELLAEHKIPFDHYHHDDNACEVWTNRHRLQDGVLEDVGDETPVQSLVSDLAKKVLDKLKANDLDGAIELLNGAIESSVNH